MIMKTLYKLVFTAVSMLIWLSVRPMRLTSTIRYGHFALAFLTDTGANIEDKKSLFGYSQRVNSTASLVSGKEIGNYKTPLLAS